MRTGCALPDATASRPPPGAGVACGQWFDGLRIAARRAMSADADGHSTVASVPDALQAAPEAA